MSDCVSRCPEDRPMSAVFKKMNLTDQREIVVCDAPKSFDAELKALHGVKVIRDPKNFKAVQFALAFVMTQVALDAIAKKLAAAAEGDAILWFAYPKGTSKRYQCDFNRDTGWVAIRKAGFDSVRQVAIDEDWSALRFRRVEFIKNSTRRP
jgi:hypothetical protein